MPLDLSMFSNKLQRYMAQFQLTAAALSESTGIEAARVSGLMKGSDAPTGDEILIIADYFRCDFKFFISNEKLAPFEQTESLFRKHDSVLTASDRWAIQEFLFLCESQEFLLTQLQQYPRRPFNFVKRGSFFKGHGEDAAKDLHRHLGYASDQIPANVFDDFRRIGIHVFRRQLGRSTISGLFIRHPTAGACVLVNDSEDVFRQRFTAAHEAGHAILDTDKDFVVSFAESTSGNLVEIRANAFASRLLLPHTVLTALPEPQTWSPETFVQYAVRLMVNAETLAYGLHDARLISDARKREFTQLRIPRDAKTDVELPASLSPRSRERKRELLQRGLSDSYVALCFDAYERDVITAARLAEMLLISEQELSAMASLYGRALANGN